MSKDAIPRNQRIVYSRGPRDNETTASELTPIRAIRLKCLDCSGGSFKEAAECPSFRLSVVALSDGASTDV